MRQKPSQPEAAKRILVRPSPAQPAELAAANEVVTAWQTKAWAQPLPQRQEALIALLEVLDG
ncbi:MAG: hypothetical protein H7338_10620 [Candidatus Sericytochromatia bacterium]|nr:hypothetical protein [Candidatus Sericytochromatia bacterium]